MVFKCYRIKVDLLVEILRSWIIFWFKMRRGRRQDFMIFFRRGGIPAERIARGVRSQIVFWWKRGQDERWISVAWVKFSQEKVNCLRIRWSRILNIIWSVFVSSREVRKCFTFNGAVLKTAIDWVSPISLKMFEVKLQRLDVFNLKARKCRW